MGNPNCPPSTAEHFQGEFPTVQVLVYGLGISKLDIEQRTQPTLTDRLPLTKLMTKTLGQNQNVK